MTEELLEAYNGLIGNWDIESIISEISNSWDREAMTDLFKISAKQHLLIHQLRGALGYAVPGDIIENPDIKNGIAEALSRQVEELREENKRLEEVCKPKEGIEQEHEMEPDDLYSRIGMGVDGEYY